MEVWTQETIRKNYVGDGKCSAPGPIVPWWSWNVFFFENSTLSDVNTMISMIHLLYHSIWFYQIYQT